MPPSLEPLLPFAPILVFVGIWFAVCTLIAWLTGHPRLLDRFPPVDEPLSYSSSWASGRGPNGTKANGALTVGVGLRGLHLAPNAIFRPPWWWGIPCVPWHEIVYEGERPYVWSKGHALFIPSLGIRWTLSGPAGEAVAEALRARGRTRA